MNYIKLISIFFLLIFFNSCSASYESSQPLRSSTSLVGEWELTQTESFDLIPGQFNRKVPVPGLIDLADPAFTSNDEQLFNDKVYWYKRNFTLQKKASLAQLKIHKAKYHTKVYVNNQYVGDNLYSFTPSKFEIAKYLNPPGQENQIMVAVGSMNMLPDTVVKGRDFEKTKYIPGIYDKVEIIQAGYPFISNIQIAPDIENPSIRVQAHLTYQNNESQSTKLEYVIRELNSGKMVASGGKTIDGSFGDFTVEIPEGRLWSPEDPFLYTLELRTPADSKKTRFGLRSFEFKKDKPYAILNNKPYYMRGTNVNLYRFFEDDAREKLPWNDEWVIDLLKSYKDLNWNSLRFCIGFPPERWYDIADSLGIMVQDEYPIWWGGRNDFEVESEYLVGEYKSWMKERWNHPSVVIWDAQNESITEETGEAIQQVRSLDLSNRPWDNGWAPPQAETDPIESHPYLFSRYSHRFNIEPSSDGELKDLLSGKLLPDNDPNERMPPEDGRYCDNPIIINEYAWLWLNRDGSTTTLTDQVYDTIAGDALSTQERRELYARYLGILTEYWRAHRTSAAILHFCGLAYSRPNEPRGQTSDHFIDIEKLKYDPMFLKYVKPAFAPVGLMIDFWDNNVATGSEKTVLIRIVNDTYEPFQQKIKLQVKNDAKVISSQAIKTNVEAIGDSKYLFGVTIPEDPGEYELRVSYDTGDETVFSSRLFSVLK